MNKNLYKFFWDCDRSGDVEGIFVASEEEIDNAIGKRVNFGEILGKHSEVSGTLKVKDFKRIDVSFDVIEQLIPHLGTTWSGYNPLYYIKCDECGEIPDYCECDEEEDEKNEA